MLTTAAGATGRARPTTAAAPARDSGDDRTRTRLFAVIVTLYLLLASVPSYVMVVSGGRMRGTAEGMAVLTETSAADLSRTLLAACLVGVCLVTMAICWRQVVTRPNGIQLGMLLILVGGILGSATSSATTPWSEVLVNVSTLTAIAALRPQLSDLRILAVLGSLLAAFSIVFGLVDDRAWMYGSLTAADTKAFIGTGLLAGPFPHMNNLGMSMAMALPFAFLMRTRRGRLLAVGLMLSCLLLTASRTSLVAVGVMCAAAVLMRLLRPQRRQVLTVVTFALCAVVFVLPWLTNDPAAFTKRGLIWMIAREKINENPWLGLGFDAFSLNGDIANRIGSALGGHNPVMQYWVVGGVLGALGVLFAMVSSTRSAGRVIDASVVPALAVVCLWTLAIDEMPFRPDAVLGQTWISLALLSAISGLRPTLAPNADRRAARDRRARTMTPMGAPTWTS